ncbi:MAG: helix-turn-helix domain-containing protein [Actinomycetota bacterium]
MEVEESFVLISGLICEPTRAKMLWNLLDGRAYTATELAVVADISATSASNHLSKMLEADLLKVETQGRHRYYSFAKPEVAYAVESLANLVNNGSSQRFSKSVASGIKNCRTCYDHLAGFVAVKLVEALEQNEFLRKTETAYSVTEEGWKWFADFEISKNDFAGNRRPLTRQCLDWSERRPHLAGQLGAVFLEKVLQRNWFEKIQFSRELILTSKGQQEIYKLLGVSLR